MLFPIELLSDLIYNVRAELKYRILCGRILRRQFYAVEKGVLI